MSQSRMKRNEKLHKAVHNEIAYKKNIQDEKSIIHSTFEKLKKIDLEFFNDKLAKFDAKHQFEKPYLDKDKSSSLFPEELKYEIKQEISNLKKIGKKELSSKSSKIEKNEKEGNEINLKKDKYINLYNNLLQNEANFKKNIEKLREKQSHKSVSSNIDITRVQQIRSNDNRSTHEMIIEVNEKNDRSYNQIAKILKTNDKKFRFKWGLAIIIILIILMILAIITPIFIA